jgi:hypothetical protein
MAPVPAGAEAAVVVAAIRTRDAHADQIRDGRR